MASRITTSAKMKYPIPAPNTKVLKFVRLKEPQLESPAAIRATARTPSFNQITKPCHTLCHTLSQPKLSNPEDKGYQ